MPEVSAERKLLRGKEKFTREVFEGLCEVQCSQAEIEAIFRTDIRTLKEWVVQEYEKPYDEMYKKFSDGGKASLRRTQFKLAQKNTAMAIWLGKQWLGQREVPEFDKGFDGSLASLLETLKTLQKNRAADKVQKLNNKAYGKGRRTNKQREEDEKEL